MKELAILESEYMSKVLREAESMKEQMRKDYEAGKRDCKFGIYDKWYRYHHYMDGRAYDLGWVEANKTIQNETVKFI